jgi:hypothetical protein
MYSQMADLCQVRKRMRPEGWRGNEQGSKANQTQAKTKLPLMSLGHQST